MALAQGGFERGKDYSHGGWPAQSSVEPTLGSIYEPATYMTSMATQQYDPQPTFAAPTDLESSFPRCLASEEQLFNNLWDPGLELDNHAPSKMSFDTPALITDSTEYGLAPIATTSSSHPGTFSHRPAWDHLASPSSDFSAVNEPAWLNTNTEYTSSILGFETPNSSPQNALMTAQRNRIAQSSPRHRFRTSPYTVANRSRSHSDGLVSLSRTQRSSYLINTVISMPHFESQGSYTSVPADATSSFGSHGSYPAGSVDITSGLASGSTGPLFQPQPKPILHPEFDLTSFDIAMPLEGPQPNHKLASSNTFDSPEPTNPLSLINSPDRNLDLASPPDLFAPLSFPPLSPRTSPSSQMPRPQTLRFPLDLYTPPYIRNHGKDREGWCGFCRPGRWLVLKNSAFWYDKSFTHGISAASGTAFESPKETRRSGDGWEGLCGECGQWVGLVGGRGKGGVPWFRHAYKCHTHVKVKDMSKRPRETAVLLAETAKKS